jgi:hypothetical protein
MDLSFMTVLMSGLTHGECYDVQRTIVRLVHNHNTDHDMRVAIAYPDYRLGIQTDVTNAESYGEEQRLIRLRKGFLGHSAQLFGCASALDAIHARCQSMALGDISGITIEPPMVAPTGSRYVTYKAHKGLTKMTPSRLRRAIRRRAWEHDAKCLTPDQLERKYVEGQRRARATTHLPNLGIYSRTTEQVFSIFIERLPAAEMKFAPNAYGFSTSTTACSLPVF